MIAHKLMLDKAADYLKGAGVKVVDREWSGAEGALDLVAAEGRDLVVVAVWGVPARNPAMSKSRSSRQRRLAVAWMAAHGRRYDRVRVDVVTVVQNGSHGWTIEHVRGVDK